MRRRDFLLSTAASLAAALVPHEAAAQVEVEIRRGQVRAIPIAIAEFSGGGFAGEITQII